MENIQAQKNPLLLGSEIDLRAFFYEQVQAAQKNQNLKLNENVEFYVVNLLYEYATAFQFDDSHDCLALILQKAIESPFQERVILYKKIADTALYFSGYFQEFFNNKTFDIRYYIQMGSIAYAELSALMKRKDTYSITMSQIYQDMNLYFLQAVDVLLYVSEQTNPNASLQRSTLSIYEAWLQTDSAHLKKELYQRGIIPVRMGAKKVC